MPKVTMLRRRKAEMQTWTAWLPSPGPSPDAMLLLANNLKSITQVNSPNSLEPLRLEITTLKHRPITKCSSLQSKVIENRLKGFHSALLRRQRSNTLKQNFIQDEFLKKYFSGKQTQYRTNEVLQ